MLTKYYEELLKIVISDYYAGKTSKWRTIKDLSISERDAEFLSAKGLCSMPGTLGDSYYISPTKAGLTYFEDKRERYKSIVINWSFNFGMAVLSAVCGSVLTLLIQQAIF